MSSSRLIPAFAASECHADLLWLFFNRVGPKRTCREALVGPPEGAVVPKKKMLLESISQPRIIVAGQIPDVMVGVNEGDSFLVFVPCPAN